MRLFRECLPAVLALAVPPAGAQQRGADDDAAIRARFEIMRRELAAHGTITEYAPNASGEIVSRRIALRQGRDACEWVLAIESKTILRRVSAPLYRSSQTVPLAAIEPGTVTAHPLRERQWCCARSAEVEFAATGGRQAFRTRAGTSWFVSDRAWIAFDDAAAAARAGAALAEAVHLCRRPGA